MYIPMIFFTIIIEKRKVTPQEREAILRQQKALQELENQRLWHSAGLPEYCTRI
ncbi:YrzI family protein [Brevibacillus sp. H7]|jgi:hypothetical protein|uniref:YrzI family protein n=1 Tax=Brevibacillus sp. H7 TaxID=3349138 RepID=UPI00382CD07E